MIYDANWEMRWLLYSHLSFYTHTHAQRSIFGIYLYRWYQFFISVAHTNCGALNLTHININVAFILSLHWYARRLFSSSGCQNSLSKEKELFTQTHNTSLAICEQEKKKRSKNKNHSQSSFREYPQFLCLLLSFCASFFLYCAVVFLFWNISAVAICIFYSHWSMATVTL